MTGHCVSLCGGLLGCAAVEVAHNTPPIWSHFAGTNSDQWTSRCGAIQSGASHAIMCGNASPFLCVRGVHATTAGVGTTSLGWRPHRRHDQAGDSVVQGTSLPRWPAASSLESAALTCFSSRLCLVPPEALTSANAGQWLLCCTDDQCLRANWSHPYTNRQQRMQASPPLRRMCIYHAHRQRECRPSQLDNVLTVFALLCVWSTISTQFIHRATNPSRL